MWKLQLVSSSVVNVSFLFSERIRYGEARRQDKISQWSGETLIFIKYVTSAYVTSCVLNTLVSSIYM